MKHLLTIGIVMTAFLCQAQVKVGDPRDGKTTDINDLQVTYIIVTPVESKGKTGVVIEYGQDKAQALLDDQGQRMMFDGGQVAVMNWMHDQGWEFIQSQVDRFGNLQQIYRRRE